MSDSEEGSSSEGECEDQCPPVNMPTAQTMRHVWRVIWLRRCYRDFVCDVPLHHPRDRIGCTRLIAAIIDDRPAEVRRLTAESSCDLEETFFPMDYDTPVRVFVARAAGTTPLHFAAATGSLSCVKALFQEHVMRQATEAILALAWIRNYGRIVSRRKRCPTQPALPSRFSTPLIQHVFSFLKPDPSRLDVDEETQWGAQTPLMLSLPHCGDQLAFHCLTGTMDRLFDKTVGLKRLSCFRYLWKHHRHTQQGNERLKSAIDAIYFKLPPQWKSTLDEVQRELQRFLSCKPAEPPTKRLRLY
jgi:hypothetical protein